MDCRSCPTITTNQGTPIIDNENTLKLSSRGPLLLQDFIFREKITQFDHERIPSRRVHSRGSGAHGKFVSYDNWTNLTKAKFLSEAGKETPIFVRFSQTLGDRGSSDMVRDIRGFAIKFYTEEGNYDIVGNNVPVFPIQDPIQFPDFINSGQEEPDSGYPQATAAHDNFWDFVSLTPESAHFLTWVMSPIGVPSSYRKMNGASVNTFKFVSDNKISLIKLHFISLQGLEGMEWSKVQETSGKDPDRLRRDLWEAINNGNYPEWELAVQIMDIETELDHNFDPLDPTKIWPVSEFPMIKLGKFTLNKNPDNFFGEVEQVAFCPANLVPGIDLSDDPILHGRLFSYLDTQISRLGVNFVEIPINRPHVEVINNQQNGKGRMRYKKGPVNYSPNTIAGGCPFASPSGWTTYSKPICGLKSLERPLKFGDHFSQASERWMNVSDLEREHIIDAFAFELSGVARKYIVNNVINNLLVNICPGLADEVKNRIKPRLKEDGTRIKEDLSGRIGNITHHHV